MASSRSLGFTVTSAISRSATTGFLSRSRSMVRSAPPEIWRARWAASRTRSNLFGILSTQSSTVTRAIRRSEKAYPHEYMGCQEGCANSLRVLQKSRKAERMADRSAEPVTRSPIRADIAGNKLELIESGEERLSMLLVMIGGAQRSIKMLMNMFNHDRAGGQV